MRDTWITAATRVATVAGVVLAAGPLLPAAAQSPVLAVQAPTATQPTGDDAASLVRRALSANREIAAARLDLERGRARLRQAGLRSNPTLDVNTTTGRLTRSPDERELTIGVAIPIDVGGVRRRRVELAEAEVSTIEAEIADRERRLTRDVIAAYVETLAAVREARIIDALHQLDQETTRVVRVRVDQQDAPPLELNLLLTEVDRLRSRRALVEGRVRSSLAALTQIVGAAPNEQVDVADAAASVISAVTLPETLESALAFAQENRPDLKAARLSEVAADAGLRLVRAEAAPPVTVSAAFISGQSLTDLPEPIAAIPDRDQTLAFGVSVGLPFFNRNQGALAEAGVAVRQARVRREFVEQQIRGEITAAFRRVQAARSAVEIFEQGVITRTMDNLRVMRAAYNLGEFRITDLITEQRRALDAQREETEALLEWLKAVSDLQTAMGRSFSLRP